MTAGIRLAIVNQAQGGGATEAARDVLEWGPSRGFEVRYFPERATDTWAESRAVLEAFAPDVVHLHCWYNHYPFSAIREIAERWPVVLTVHDVAVINQYGTECWECYRNPWCLGCPALGPIRRWRPNYRIFDRLRKRRLAKDLRIRLVYPSEWMRRRLSRSEWRRFEGQVIPYGIDTAFFASGRPARERFGLGPGPVILFSGHMYSAEDHRKGLPDLLAALPALRARFPDLIVAIAGKVVAGVPPPSGVFLLGDVARRDLPDLYASADVFCLPSRGDNLPVAVLEAMAAGLPVVATRVGGIPEEVLDGTTGLLVPPASTPAIASAVDRLLSDPAFRSRCGEAGRTRAISHFSRDLAASRLADLLVRCQEHGEIRPAPRVPGTV